MAPELFTSKDTTSAADIWAVGVIAYQLCMLKVPFDTSDGNRMRKDIIYGEIPAIPERKEGYISIFR